jgi:hypothetical protein
MDVLISEGDTNAYADQSTKWPLYAILNCLYFTHHSLHFSKLIVVCKIGWGGMDLTDLAQDRDQWGSVVNMTMNLRVP